LARYLTPLVEAIGPTSGASKGAEVDHFVVIPKKRVLGGNASALVWDKARIGDPGELAGCVLVGTQDGEIEILLSSFSDTNRKRT
jgi:hypothetical protein